MAKSTPVCEKHEWIVLQAPDGRLVIMCDRCQHIAGTVPATGYAPVRYIPYYPAPYTWPTITWQSGSAGNANTLTYDTEQSPAQPVRHEAGGIFTNTAPAAPTFRIGGGTYQ